MEQHGNFNGNDRVHYGKPWDFAGAPFSDKSPYVNNPA